MEKLLDYEQKKRNARPKAHKENAASKTRCRAPKGIYHLRRKNKIL